MFGGYVAALSAEDSFVYIRWLNSIHMFRGVFLDHFVPHYGFQQKSDSSDIFMFYTTGVKLILVKRPKIHQAGQI